MENTKPSVVFINRVYPPSRAATGRVLRDLARAFVKQGWDVRIITTGPVAKTEQDGPIRITRVQANEKKKTVLSYMMIWFRLFFAGLKTESPDLLVTLSDPPLLVVAGRYIAAIKKAAHIHWCHDVYPDILPSIGFNMPKIVMRFFRARCYGAMRKCDKVVAIGRCMAHYLASHGLEPGRVAVIPNWPDNELVNHEELARRRKARRLKRRKRMFGINKIRQAANSNIKSRKEKASSHDLNGARIFADLFKDETDPKFRILYPGNLGRAHPIDTIVEAMEILAPDYPEIEFVFIGNGAQFDYLAKERARLNLSNLRLLPWQPIHKFREIMESGDLHLVSMQHETSGLLVPSKIYAALAVGRPSVFVGPEDCEAGQIITDFKAGKVVPQGDATQLADIIKQYRFDSDMWFEAHEGALAAGKIFVPEESIGAWIRRAHTVIGRKESELMEQKQKAA